MADVIRHCDPALVAGEAIHFTVILSVAKNLKILHFVQDDNAGLLRRCASRNDV